jgi:hypothetical protein
VADRDAADAEIGDLARQVADVVDLAVGQQLLAEGRDGDGGLLQVGGPAFGGDHHLFDGRGGVGVSLGDDGGAGVAAWAALASARADVPEIQYSEIERRDIVIPVLVIGDKVKSCGVSIHIKSIDLAVHLISRF